MDPNTVVNKKANFFKVHRIGVAHFLTIILLVPLLFVLPEKIYGVGVLCLLMIIWFAIDVMPAPITSLLPVVFIPLMGVVDSNKTCMSYMTNNSFFLILCFQFALAFEVSKTADYMGFQILKYLPMITPKILLIQLMSVSYLMSILLPNALVCSLLFPVSKSIIKLFESVEIHKLNRNNPVREDSYPVASRITACFALGVAYAATMGGMVTMGSSESAYALYEIYNKHLGGRDDGPSFLSYIAVGVLVSLPLAICTCVYLLFLFLDLFRQAKAEFQMYPNAYYKQALRDTENPLPKLQASNILIILLWVTGAISCIFAMFAPFLIDDERIREMYVKVSSYLMGSVFLLLILPTSYTFLNYFRCRRPDPNTEDQINLLQWAPVQSFLPWGYVFVFGASECIAYSFQRAHLQCFLGDLVRNHSQYLKALSWMKFSIIATAIGSNQAIATNFMNWALKMGFDINRNDGWSMYSIALGSNLSFLMPISSITNCMAVGWFNIRFIDVFLAGIAPTLIGTILSVFVSGILIRYLQPGFNQEFKFPNVTETT